MNRDHFFPVHSLYEQLPTNVANVLPAVHALTGCDTVSKVGTKRMILKASFDHYNLIQDFGKAPLSEDMMISAEKFLLRCICTDQHVSTFDDLRVEIYHKNSLKFDIERFPPSSNAVREHIKREYIQCYIWINASNIETIELDPINYGYRLNDRDLDPAIVSQPPIPNDFPEPCKCKVCSRRTVCRCRLLQIPCCEYYRCNGSSQCKNPSKLTNSKMILNSVRISYLI